MFCRKEHNFNRFGIFLFSLIHTSMDTLRIPMMAERRCVEVTGSRFQLSMTNEI